MSYEIVLTQRAQRELEQSNLPTEAIDAFVAGLEKLAGNPVQLGVRTHFPFLPTLGQIYEFSHRIEEGGRFIYRVFFKYTEDEKRLLIIAMSCHRT